MSGHIALGLCFLVTALLCIQADTDVLCKSGTKDYTVNLPSNTTYKFGTAYTKYNNGQRCTATYTLTTCKQASISCSSFSTIGLKGCTQGDYLLIKDSIGDKRFCNTDKPTEYKPTGNFSMKFVSDATKASTGLTCTVTCDSPSVGSESAFSAPSSKISTFSTVTSPLTTPTTISSSPTTLPKCKTCLASNGNPCIFPFILGNRTYTDCTLDNAADGKPWCSTKVGPGGFHVSGNWGTCDSTCRSVINPSASASCQSTETFQPYANLNNMFPATCSERLKRSHKNIYFLGNSYTYQNDLPAMIRNLATAAGVSATMQQRTPGGEQLSGHASFTIPAGDWDILIIQGQSQEPSFSPSSIYNSQLQSTKMIVEKIRKTNPCILPIFFQTWGRLNGDSGNCPYYSPVCTFDGMQDRLTESYNTFAYVNQPAKVSPAGEAFRLIANRGYLFSSDGSHPSMSGTYLTACTFLETIWGNSCIGNSYKPVPNAAQLQQIANQAVKSRSWAWPQPGGPPCPACIG